MNKFWISSLLVLMALIAVLSFVNAPTTSSTTISWVVPANASHTVAYGGACSASAFYFVEDDAEADGTDTNLVPYDAASAGAACQDDSTAPMTITNSGNVTIDFNLDINTTLQTGVTLKAWLGSSGCGTNGLLGAEATCSRTGLDDDTVPTTNLCVSVGDSTRQIIADLAAAGDQQICFSADFSSVAQGTNTDNLRGTSWQSLE